MDGVDGANRSATAKPIKPSVGGGGISSSSDGQQFHAGGRGAAISDINARNGNEPGVSFYTHISDQYGPFSSRIIAATAGEAPTSSTVCCITRPGCRSKSIIPTPAARLTMCSG